jgi:hypothetical protein
MEVNQSYTLVIELNFRKLGIHVQFRGIIALYLSNPC